VLVITLCLDCVGIQALKKDGVQTIPRPICRLTRINRFHGRNERQRRIVMLPKGTKIPMNVAAEMSFVSLEPGKNSWFSRDVYLFISMKKTMISPDGERWPWSAIGKRLKAFSAWAKASDNRLRHFEGRRHVRQIT